MRTVLVCRSEELDEGAMMTFVHGDTRVLVCRFEGKIFAVDAVCPHRGAMLSQGKLDGCAVVCPWHDWAFDVTSGEGLTNPMSHLCQFEVSEVAGEIVVQLPADASHEING